MEHLKELRQAKGVSQQTVGDYLDITRQAYSNYENDNRDPDNETLLKLAEFFGVSVDALLRGNATLPAKQGEDILDKVDVAFYGEYKALTDDDKETVRDMVRIMRERRAKKQE